VGAVRNCDRPTDAVADGRDPRGFDRVEFRPQKDRARTLSSRTKGCEETTAAGQPDARAAHRTAATDAKFPRRCSSAASLPESPDLREDAKSLLAINVDLWFIWTCHRDAWTPQAACSPEMMPS
jgi:hypothetical protein